MSEKDLQQEITKLETQISATQKNLNSMHENLDSMKEILQNLKDIAWNKQAKRESSSMYKVLEGKKDYTKVQSNVGEIRVDKEFMKKQIKKHLDDPKLRGMVTSQEMLSYPKVAKNVEPKFDERHQGYNWKALANDGNTIIYGERDWGQGNELLTIHSETGRDERGQLRREFNDRNFHNPASTKRSITQNQTESQGTNSKQAKIKALKDEVKKISEKNIQTKDKDIER